MTETFSLAVVGSPFGLKGFVKVKSLSGETSHLESLKDICLKQGNTEKTVNIEETMPWGGSGQQENSGEFLLMKFEGIDSPESAKTLTGALLIGDRSQAAQLKEGEFYIEDLKGIEVVATTSDSASGRDILGHITDILEGGGGELAEIKLLSGESRLVPFRKEFFGDISMEKRQAILLEQWILE
ncbi:MAG: ribosome maturation factor RimM [Treponema sp.]|nr:ribosome maturation factor RimM [Treponema sp.]